MDILRILHSWVRWIVILIALIDLIYFALGWLQSRSYTQLARRLMSAFSMAISLQWLIGLIFLIVLGSRTSFSTMPWGHVGVMTLAVFVSNVPNMLRRRQLGDKQRFLVNLITLIVVLVLVFIGISMLPQGMQWRFYTGA